MEITSKFYNHSLYVSAPSSPSRCISSLHSMHYFSAPTSPMKINNGISSFGYEFEEGTPRTNEDVNSNFDDFEFETSKKFGDEVLEFEKQQCRGSKLPTMAFADELFSNGQVLPLKAPPGLQCNKNSTASSPRSSPSSVLKVPFPRRSMWNDEFDPFTVALEKVKEEKRVKKSKGKSHHRWARSLSPFRTTTPQWSGDYGGCNQLDQFKRGGPLEPMLQHKMGPKPNELMEPPKGSVYASWFRVFRPQKSSQMELSPEGPPKQRGLPFGKRVRPVKVGHEGTINSVSATLPGPMMKTTGEKTDQERGGGASTVESRKQKRKEFLPRYPLFGREKNEVKLREKIAALWKGSYFRRLSSKFKGNAQSNTKKNLYEPNMGLTQYRPRMVPYLRFGIEKPKQHV